MKASQIIQNALSLLKDGEAWTQGAYARNSNGDSLLEENPLAIRFCLFEALKKAAGPESVYQAQDLIRDVLTKRYPKEQSIIAFNDAPDTTFVQVKEVLKEAAILAQQEENKGVAI